MQGVLKRDKRSENEYTFIGEPQTLDKVWITFGPYSIDIHKTDEGIVVDIWQKGKEDGPCIESAYVFDSVLEEEDDE